jgi:hypothetical protein
VSSCDVEQAFSTDKKPSSVFGFQRNMLNTTHLFHQLVSQFFARDVMRRVVDDQSTESVSRLLLIYLHINIVDMLPSFQNWIAGLRCEP